MQSIGNMNKKDEIKSTFATGWFPSGDVQHLGWDAHRSFDPELLILSSLYEISTHCTRDKYDRNQSDRNYKKLTLWFGKWSTFLKVFDIPRGEGDADPVELIARLLNAELSRFHCSVTNCCCRHCCFCLELSTSVSLWSLSGGLKMARGGLGFR